ncbi:MAG TPA: lasso peptide biosynthesis B2 protein [Sphingomicrobium sp.]
MGTAKALGLLCWARLLIAWVPLKGWRESLGDSGGRPASAEARRLARQVERAAAWLPFETKCLARAMALSWILRRRRIGPAVVFAVRPAALRSSKDDLHAWVEVAGETIIGDLPGAWIETLRLGAN